MSVTPTIQRWLRIGAACAAIQAALCSGLSHAQADEEATSPPANATGGDATTLIDDESAARRAEAIANSLMSPFCPGRTLSGCPSPNATVWRSDIRQWVDEGLNADEIAARLSKRAPDFNLHGSPETPLGGWIAVFLGLIALAVLAGVFRATTRRGRAGAEDSGKPSPSTRSKGKPKKGDAARPAATDGELEERLKSELEALD